MGRKKLIEQLENDAIATDTGYVEVPLFIFSEIIALLKEQEEQGYAKIKEPDCRICGQCTCRYYHELRKPTECKSYVRSERS